MIEARGLKKVFGDGTKAVTGVDFQIAEGEIFGLLGPNGAGKTTTINLFLDFIRPTRFAPRRAPTASRTACLGSGRGLSRDWRSEV